MIIGKRVTFSGGRGDTDDTAVIKGRIVALDISGEEPQIFCLADDGRLHWPDFHAVTVLEFKK